MARMFAIFGFEEWDMYDNVYVRCQNSDGRYSENATYLKRSIPLERVSIIGHVPLKLLPIGNVPRPQLPRLGISFGVWMRRVNVHTLHSTLYVWS